MTIKDLQNLMVEYGLVIRAIPPTARIVVELRHKDKYPNGHAQYLEAFKREMWVEEIENIHAGQFAVEQCRSTTATVHFSGKKFYHSLEELANDMMQFSEGNAHEN